MIIMMVTMISAESTGHALSMVLKHQRSFHAENLMSHAVGDSAPFQQAIALKSWSDHTKMISSLLCCIDIKC